MTLLEVLSCLGLDHLMCCQPEIVLGYLGCSGAAGNYPSVKYHY